MKDMHGSCVLRDERMHRCGKDRRKRIFEEDQARNVRYAPDHLSNDTLVLRGSVLGGFDLKHRWEREADSVCPMTPYGSRPSSSHRSRPVNGNSRHNNG